jgi:hypothetical protein
LQIKNVLAYYNNRKLRIFDVRGFWLLFKTKPLRESERALVITTINRWLEAALTRAISQRVFALRF